MIIVLEGAPAAGKTTTALHLVEHHDAFRIPEVNVLFPERPSPEPAHWYLARQVERWALAKQSAAKLVLLDGDPYQPVWFSWMYPGRVRPASWQAAVDYFEEHLEEVAAPAFSAHLSVDPDERYRREVSRERARGHDEATGDRKYARYVDFAGPQHAYFAALNEAFPGAVVFFEATSATGVAAALLEHEPPPASDVRDVFAFMRSWLDQHDPQAFR